MWTNQYRPDAYPVSFGNIWNSWCKRLVDINKDLDVSAAAWMRLEWSTGTLEQLAQY